MIDIRRDCECTSSPLLLALVAIYRKPPSSGCAESAFAKTENWGFIAMSRDVNTVYCILLWM